MQVYFALRFDRRDAADQAAAALQADGYEVDFQAQPDNRSVVVRASPEAAPSAEEIAAARSRLDALARELGGDFLGHGGLEQRVNRGQVSR